MMKYIILITFFFLFHNDLRAQVKDDKKVIITDSSYYSNFLGEVRNYRIFLPDDYSSATHSRYPVIYFCHGWSQRYFGSVGVPYAEYDQGNENDGDNIENFVLKNKVIVVKIDGYDRDSDELYNIRPYNIGPVKKSYRQFAIYFPEFIQFIDDNYRTIPTRENRAISGLSMGGFMAFWVAGKSPDLFCAAGSFCGSPEFLVGPKSMEVEYRHIDMYKNYKGLNVCLNYGDKDFIRAYHEDLLKIWPVVLDNFQFKMYDASHSTCGLGEMFEFFLKTFKQPPGRPVKWTHSDPYPRFNVWNYDINSDRTIPGFTTLEKVEKNGFRSSVREYLPDGQIMPAVRVSITTDKLYKRSTAYVVIDYNLTTHKKSSYLLQSDEAGRLKISLDGSIHEISISESNGTKKPDITIADFVINNAYRTVEDKESRLSIRLLNKGFLKAKRVKIALISGKEGNYIKHSQSNYGDMDAGELANSLQLLVAKKEKRNFDIQQLKILIEDGDKNSWIEQIEIPAVDSLEEIPEFEIADGRVMTVARAGIFYETLVLGKGNGDGVANPGEFIVLLVKDKNILYRTKVSSTDNFVNPFGVNLRQSDSWQDYDQCSSSAKYNTTVISSDIPQNYSLQFICEYWYPAIKQYHKKKMGLIKVFVSGNDNTPPYIDLATVSANNVLQIKLIDGAKVNRVSAKFTWKDSIEVQAGIQVDRNDRDKVFEVQLHDDGIKDDKVAGDNIFSIRIRNRKFGLYGIEAEATDTLNNYIKQCLPGTFVIY